MPVSFFPFPETIRNEQQELIEELLESTEPFCFAQAATGIGKTAAALTVALNLKKKYEDDDTENQWEQIFYLTPKHSQRDIVTKTVKQINNKYNTQFKILDWKPKRVTCLTKKDCNYKKCFYVGKFHRFKAKAMVSGIDPVIKGDIWDERAIKKFAAKEGICQYFAQKYLVPYADIVLLDYNHIFANMLPVPDGVIRRGTLIIDEAQNLPERVRSYYDFEYPLQDLKKIPEIINKLGNHLQKSVYSDLVEMQNGYLSGIPKELTDVEMATINDQIVLLNAVKDLFPDFLKNLITSFANIKKKKKLFDYEDLDIDKNICKKLRIVLKEIIEFTKEKFNKKDLTTSLEQLLRFLNYWEFYANSDSTIRYWKKVGKTDYICLHRIEVGDIIYNHCATFNKTIAMSATLSPIDFYIHEFGMDTYRDEVYICDQPSPFPKENRHIRILPHPKLTYEFWSGKKTDALECVAEYIAQVLSTSPKGRYGIFGASSGLCEKLYPFLQEYVAKKLFLVTSSVKTFGKQDLLEQFFNTKDAVLITPQGSSLTEGVDYEGDKLVGAFIVGIPISKYDDLHKIRQSYYKDKYGSQLGFLFSTVYPAASKAVQAAGRVIRTEQDKGFIIFIDKRWAWSMYNESFPSEWYSDDPAELVVKDMKRFCKEVNSFWEKEIITN